MKTCSDINALRTLIPSADGELIAVTAYYAGWQGDDKWQSGGGVFKASKAPGLADDKGLYIKPNEEWTWIRELSGYPVTVSPNMFGARGDGVTDDTAALTAAFLTPYMTVCQQDATYMTSDTVRIKNGQTTKKIINLNGATLKAKAGHLKPFFADESSTSERYEYLHGVEMFGGRLYGWVKRESAYHQVSAHNGFVAGDKSYFYHMNVRGFCDGMVLMGDSVAFDVNIDECRDNLFTVNNEGNVVSNVTGGYCLGDGFLVKGTKNIVARVAIAGAGIPANTAEPGYRAGSVFAVGQDKAPTSDCYIIDISCQEWGGGVAIVAGHNILCEHISAGNCHYLSTPNASAILNGAPVVYADGIGHIIRHIKAGESLRGVELHDGAMNVSIDDISIDACSIHPGLSASGSQSGCRIGSLAFGRLTGNQSLYLAMAGLVIDKISVNEYATTYVNGGRVCVIRQPLTIGSLVFNSSLATNTLPVVVMESNADIGDLAVNNNRAVCLQTAANVTSLPKNLTIQQKTDAMDSAVKLFGQGDSRVAAWRIKGNPSVRPAVRGEGVRLTLERYPADSLPWYIEHPASSSVTILDSSLM